MDMAEECVQKLIQLYPRSISVYIKHAEFLLGQNEIAKSLQYLKEAIQIDPGSIQQFGIMCNFLIGQKKIAEAEEFARQALAVNLVHPDIFLHLGYALKLRGKFEEAELYVRKSLQFDPNSLFAHKVLKEILNSKKKIERTEQALKGNINLESIREMRKCAMHC